MLYVEKNYIRIPWSLCLFYFREYFKTIYTRTVFIFRRPHTEIHILCLIFSDFESNIKVASKGKIWLSSDHIFFIRPPNNSSVTVIDASNVDSKRFRACSSS